MKIKYQFADGATSEVEVNEELGEFITASRREENNLSRKERYHCYSLDAALFEGQEYSDYNTPDVEMENEEVKKRISIALNHLSDTQRRRLLMLTDGVSLREIARAEGKDFKSIYESIESARKKFKKNY